MTEQAPEKRYSTPALEKGLDILELLAAHSDPLSQKAIAAALDRSINEVFRMLSTLVDRGYISRASKGDGYVLTMRLHGLMQNWPPSKRLLDAALPEMRRLASEVEQSCHLSVYSAGRLHIVANEESPLPVGITVRVGSGFALGGTASGRVLLAFQDDLIAGKWLATDVQTPELMARIKAICAQGYEMAESDRIKGLTDISCPILDQTGIGVAALTVPVLSALIATCSPADILARTRQAADRVSRQLGFHAP